MDKDRILKYMVKSTAIEQLNFDFTNLENSNENCQIIASLRHTLGHYAE